MKIIKYIFLTIWGIWCLFGILKNFSHYGFADWIIIITFTILPFVIVGIISRKSKDKNIQDKHFTEEPNHISLNECNSIAPTIINNHELNSSNNNQPTLNDSEKQPTYIETKNIIYFNNQKTISDEEIPHLIQIGYEKTLSAEQNSKNSKFHRTEREENLSLNFMMKYGSQVDALTEKFESAYKNSYKADTLNEKISLLNEAVSAFEKAKKFCYSKGKGGTIYFQDIWECLCNSQNECFSYLDNIEISLKECIFQRDIAIPEIIAIVTNTPGILQKNIYKLLPDMNKSTIRNTIKYLESQHKIVKEKKGNSYQLYIIE